MTDLFRFPSATRHDPAVDAWLECQPGARGVIARTWFTRLRKCGPDVRELLHDDCPVACVGDAAFAYVNVFAAHVNVGFFRGAYLDDPDELMEGAGKRMRHVKLRPELKCNAAALNHLIEEAYVDMKRRLGDANPGGTPDP